MVRSIGKAKKRIINTRMNQRYKCPCCGYRTLVERPPGSYEICPVCYWEDDDLQFHDLDFAGGANKVSLNIARSNFLAMGASDPQLKDLVRAPTEQEKSDE